MIAREQSILEQSRQVSDRERTTLETIIGINQSEMESYKKEIEKLEQRIAEQMQTYMQLKKLHEDKVINQQRFFDSVAAMDNLQRDRRSTGSNLSQANTNLERSRRDLAILKLAESARIVKEIGETEIELDRLKKAAAQSGDLAYGMDAASAKSSGGSIATYKIVRRNEAGRPEVLRAYETTPIMPGDIIEVGSSKVSDKAADKVFDSKEFSQNY